MENSYYSHLLELYPEKVQYLNWMKNEFDNRIYYYGEHFKNPYENKHIKRKVITWLDYNRKRVINLNNSIKYGYDNSILSEADFRVNDLIARDYNLKVLRFPWSSSLSLFSDSKINKTLTKMGKCSYRVLMAQSFIEDVFDVFNTIKRFLEEKQIKLAIFPNDLAPINRIAIDACKKIGLPTAIFLHGLPGRYNEVDDNRADYLCVWGEGIKEQYLKVGVSPEKIIVTGHPTYSTIVFPEAKKHSLSAPLVLTSSVCGAPSISDKYILSDRGKCVNFAWSVEKALKNAGAKKAVLRLHPSENPKWYRDYINTDFYKIDTLNLNDSLKQASMVIGPTSTVSMDAGIHGIPYFVFEPPMKFAYSLVPPFDGSEPSFPVAFSTDSLIANIAKGKCIHPEGYKKYIAPEFNISVLIEKAKKI